jgi:hypothetical protein
MQRLIGGRRSISSQTCAYLTVGQWTLSSLPIAIRPKVAGPIGHTRSAHGPGRSHGQGIAGAQRVQRGKVHAKAAGHLDMQSRGILIMRTWHTGCQKAYSRCSRGRSTTHLSGNSGDATVEIIQCGGSCPASLLSHTEILLFCFWDSRLEHNK